MFYFEYLLFSVLYDQMTSKPFETIMINMWFENQQQMQQITAFPINLNSKFEKVMFCINVTQSVNVLSGAYPISA